MMDVETYKVLDSAQDKAEEVRAMFGSIKAVRGAVDDYVYYQLMQTKHEDRYKELLEYHGGNLQELLAVMEHLLSEMEGVQSELVLLIREKAFAARKELETASAAVSGAKDG